MIIGLIGAALVLVSCFLGWSVGIGFEQEGGTTFVKLLLFLHVLVLIAGIYLICYSTRIPLT